MKTVLANGDATSAKLLMRCSNKSAKDARDSTSAIGATALSKIVKSLGYYAHSNNSQASLFD